MSDAEHAKKNDKTETNKMSDESEKKTSEAPKAKSEAATKSPEAVPKPKTEAKAAGKPEAQDPVGTETSSPASAIITLFVLIAAALALATR